MAVIYLIRHGQASFQADDYDRLSELGEHQAGLLGEALVAHHIQPTDIQIGTMRRHKQTAELSLDSLKPEATPELNACWNEYPHQDILRQYDERMATPASTKAYMKSLPDPKKAFQSAFLAAMGRWTNGEHDADYQESWPEFCDRIITGFDQLVAASNGATVVYTSGGPISLISCYLLGLPLSDFMKINWTLVNTGITKVITRPSESSAHLLTLNEHSFLNNNDNNKLITYT